MENDSINPGRITYVEMPTLEIDGFWASAIGALLYGAIVTVALIVLGVIYHVAVVSILGILSGACSYICFAWQASGGAQNTLGKIIVAFFIALSVLLGALALLMLVIALGMG